MAQACDLCNEFPAAFLITMLENGETSYQCPRCYASLGIAAARQVLKPEAILEELRGVLEEAGVKLNGGAPAGSRRKREPEPEPEPQPGPETPEALEGAQAPTQDS